LAQDACQTSLFSKAVLDVFRNPDTKFEKSFFLEVRNWMASRLNYQKTNVVKIKPQRHQSEDHGAPRESECIEGRLAKLLGNYCYKETGENDASTIIIVEAH
jgi:hypothetical protein